MRQFLERVLHTLLVLWAVVTILFLMFRLMPGSPLAAYLNDNLSEEQQQLILQQFGLDRPLYEQYVIYLANLARGELGVSFFQRRPVVDILMEAFPNTIVLTLASLVVAYIFGVIAGAFLAWRRDTWIERTAVPIVLAVRAAPEFWVGMVLLAVFGFGLGWLPSGGTNSPGAAYDSEIERFLSLDFLRHLALPMLTLAVYLQGLPLLLMRSNMLEVMHDEFVTMARMKGLSEWSIVIRHAARNALLPVLTAFTIGVGISVGGNVVVEVVFSWPGIGRLLVRAVSSLDYPLAQGAFLLIALVFITMNFIADMLYVLLDPRVSHARVA